MARRSRRRRERPTITEWPEPLGRQTPSPPCFPSCFPSCPPFCHPSCEPVYKPGCNPSGQIVCKPAYFHR